MLYEKAPRSYNGKPLICEETFRSPFAQPSRSAAEHVLDEIRSTHSREKGWVELSYEIEEVRGGYIAVRHHAQYK